MKQNTLDETKFMEAPLDIRSKVDLQPLVAALGKRVEVYFVGRENRAFKAYISLNMPFRSTRSATPESEIRRFCKLILQLSPEARKLWDESTSRTFNIGIQAPGRNSYYWSAVSPNTIKAAAEIDAGISITVYGQMRVVKPSSKTIAGGSSQ